MSQIWNFKPTKLYGDSKCAFPNFKFQPKRLISDPIYWDFLPPTHFQTLYFWSRSSLELFISSPGLHFESFSTHRSSFFCVRFLVYFFCISTCLSYFSLLDYFSLVFFLSHLFGPSRHCNLFAEVTVGFRLRRKLSSRLKRQLKSSSHPR